MPAAEKHKLVYETPNYVISHAVAVSEEQEHKPLQFPGDPFRSAIQRKTNTPSSQSPSDLFTLCSHAFRLVILSRRADI